MNLPDQSVEQQFLREIALQCNFTGDTLAAFLKRFDKANAEKSNQVLAKFIEWNAPLPENTAQKLQDELQKIYDGLRHNGCELPTPKPGQRLFDQAYQWLWKVKFAKWQQQSRWQLEPQSNSFHSISKIDDLVQKVRSNAPDNVPEILAASLERILKGKPNNPRVRRELASLYREINMHALSWLHYRTLVEDCPNDGEILNMLGVQYEHLGITIRAARFYRESAEVGISVAASNLFYLYLNCPKNLSIFPEEVEQLLKKFKLQENVDPNVLSALSDIHRFEKKEQDDELKHLRDAQQHQRFFLMFAEAYFMEEFVNLDNFEGLWLPEKESRDIKIIISYSGSQIKAICNLDFKTSDYFIGLAKNRAVQLTFTGDQDEYNRGLAYLSSDFQQLHVMWFKNNQPDISVLTKSCSVKD